MLAITQAKLLDINDLFHVKQTNISSIILKLFSINIEQLFRTVYVAKTNNPIIRPQHIDSAYYHMAPPTVFSRNANASQGSGTIALAYRLCPSNCYLICARLLAIRQRAQSTVFNRLDAEQYYDMINLVLLSLNSLYYITALYLV